jgi:phosphoglycerate dehydrogenase-like enzyme
VEWVTKDELFRRSDVLSLHVNLSDRTRGIVGAEQFALMKPTAYFVNCGRARTVDDDALLAALKENRIAGAGLDVFTIEPLPRTSEFRDLDNAILTPHSAGGPAGWTDTFARLRVNLDRVAAGRSDVTIAMRKGDPQFE